MAGSEPLGLWREPDRLVVAYAIGTSVPLSLGAIAGAQGCALQVLLNVLVVGGVACLCWASQRTTNKALRFLRLMHAPLLFLFFYRQTATIWPVLYQGSFDAPIAAIDQAIFGFQPSLSLAPAVPSAVAGEIFSFAYFAYYCFTPVLLLTVLFTRGYEQAERIIVLTARCFFACYAIFWIFPVVGPFYWFSPGTGPALAPGLFFNQILYFFTGNVEVPTGAFPSSHLAVAVVQTFCARQFAPRLFPAMLTITLLMVPAVLYLRAHYAVDVVAGVLVGLLFLVSTIHRR
ncbi:MAG: phosphatase PAP2 family protein [Pseudomonadota bacterium]